ncbi:putative reverse transcriptase domain-containing protein [Tanacetum coccineum]
MAFRVSDLCASFALVLVQISLIGVFLLISRVSFLVGFNQSKACMTFSFAEVVLGTRIYFPRCQFELTPCFDKLVLVVRINADMEINLDNLFEDKQILRMEEAVLVASLILVWANFNTGRRPFVCCWDEDEEEAFQSLKEKLCGTPILALPDGSEDFIVYCDASHQGLGAVLMQRQKDIAYAYR